MPKLIIDHIEIDVAPGTKVIDAAERVGISIPRFCYHPALGSVGACRVCAVKVLEGPRKGILMSCMIEAVEGMVVSTTDAEAVAFRKRVIEWLMINHPHDCPVCDEGGHCLLQDTTIAGGHGLRAFAGSKRTHRDQDLGPLVQHEMNRCIQCYRCTRFYREFAGYPDLGVMGIASRVYFGRMTDGVLQSPFSGNLIDLCPTGVYTDKPSRFKGRRWDFQRKPSICIHCSLGCHTTVNVRYREVVRQEARYSPSVNGHFICDRGRYGLDYASEPDRPRSSRCDGQPVQREKALLTASEGLARITRESGPGAVAMAGSATRSSLETLSAVDRACRTTGWSGPSFFHTSRLAAKAARAASRVEPDLTVTLGELSSADLILVVGADPVSEAPMAALGLRQAARQGAKIIVMDPRPVELPMHYHHLPTPPGALYASLAALVKKSIGRKAAETMGEKAVQFYDQLPDDDPLQADRMAESARDIKTSRHPVILCGTDIVPEPVIGMAADAALLLRAEKGLAGLFYLMPGANGFGAAIMADPAQGFDRILGEIEAGRTRALVLVENDPFWYVPDRPRLTKALDRLDLLVVLDYLNSTSAQRADVFIPTATVYERGGTFVDQAGNARRAKGSFKGGTPIAQTGKDSHPPRTFEPDIPGSDTPPAGELALRLFDPERQTANADSLAWLIETHRVFTPLLLPDRTGEKGRKLAPWHDADLRWDRPADPMSGDSEDRLEMLLVEATFGTEELSCRSFCLGEREAAPRLLMQSDDALAMGLSDGDTAVIRTETGDAEIGLGVRKDMARGVLILPRSQKIKWQRFGGDPQLLPRDQTGRESGEDAQ